MDAETYLVRLTERLLSDAERSQVRPDQEAGFEALSEISIAATALVSVGALERDSAERAVQGMRSELVRLGVVSEETIAPEPFGDLAPIGPTDWGPPPTRGPSALIKVIPLARDLGTIEGGPSAVLISLEVWSDHLVLRCMLVARRDPSGRTRPRWAWTIHDDAGTAYAQGGGMAGGGDDVWHEEIEVRPAPPPEATVLTFVARKLGPPRDEPRTDLPWTGMGAPGEEILSIDIPLDG